MNPATPNTSQPPAAHSPESSLADRPGEAEWLASYSMEEYPSTAVTVDLVCLTIRNGQLSVLLVQREDHPYKGWWALPGGFKHPSEPLEEAARRELAEETGLDVLDVGGHIEQLGTWGDPGRDPRGHVVSVAYLAFLPDLPLPSAAGDAADARFWPVADIAGAVRGISASTDAGDTDAVTEDAASEALEQVALAFDHTQILNSGLERARSKLEYTTLAASFCEPPFTISDLRRVYEIVWGVSLDQSNFRRKVVSTPGFVSEAGGSAAPAGGGRPAQLYYRGDAVLLHPAMLRTDLPDLPDSQEVSSK